MIFGYLFLFFFWTFCIIFWFEKVATLVTDFLNDHNIFENDHKMKPVTLIFTIDTSIFQQI